MTEIQVFLIVLNTIVGVGVAAILAKLSDMDKRVISLEVELGKLRERLVAEEAFTRRIQQRQNDVDRRN